MTKALISGFLISTVVRSAVVAKPQVLSISLLTSLILALRVVVVGVVV